MDGLVVQMPQLTTNRLLLRRWRDDDRDAFAQLNADPEVMRDLGGPLNRRESDRKLDRYVAAFDEHGYGRWLIERPIDDGTPEFVGYVGVMPVRGEHPLGDHDEIGWRLHRQAWGHGFASEAAAAALQDCFSLGLTEILSYTAPDNQRSQAVMARLGLQRDESRDFTASYDDVGTWTGLVWVATNPQRR